MPIENRKGRNLISVISVTSDQWDIIDPRVVITRYGPEQTIFDSIEDILNAPKVVTLNGKAMWGGTRATRSIAARIEDFHSIFKLPSGGFAVASQKLSRDLQQDETIIFSSDQYQVYDCHTRIMVPLQKMTQFQNPVIGVN